METDLTFKGILPNISFCFILQINWVYQQKYKLLGHYSFKNRFSQHI